jgi:hypothetical protein
LTGKASCFILSPKKKEKRGGVGMLPRGWAVKNERNYRDNMNIRLPWGIKEELKRIAKQRDMTLSDLVRMAVEKFLEEIQAEEGLKR